jgi:ABC-type iron transport system FetAB ATPase subunit
VLFELDDVCLTRAGVRVLDHLSARIDPGATAIVGPSGSGKSSLLRLLNRLADPDSGRILYEGRPIGDRDVLALRREVMLVPQLPALVPGTVSDNLDFAARVARRQAIDGPQALQALQAAGLDESFADRDTSRLSVGEQQRAMLARALAVEPAVLLLDEPTSALDADATARVEEALAGLRRRRDLSVVLVTHDPGQADRLADAVIRLEPTAAGSRSHAQAAEAAS